MDIIHQNTGNAAETCKHKDYEKEGQHAVKQRSPSYEFSFTTPLNSSTYTVPDKTKAASSPLSLAIDVTPADDIFFHGHLLPLNLVSHFAVSPRSSNNLAGSLSLPTRDEKQHPGRCCSSRSSNNLINNKSHGPIKGGDRSKSLPQKLGLKRWHKGSQDKEIASKENEEKSKNNFISEVGQVIKKYARIVKPLLLSFKGKQENVHFDRHKCNSFSSGFSVKCYKQELRGRRRGEYSAPASVRTSPTNSEILTLQKNKNSGILAANGTSCSTSDSTMEELQAAIQAAIAHCKNSVSAEDKLKC